MSPFTTCETCISTSTGDPECRLGDNPLLPEKMVREALRMESNCTIGIGTKVNEENKTLGLHHERPWRFGYLICRSPFLRLGP
ncbi:hypothetical protein PHLCEN_2v12316 [Hermanssonia centrifuga]|uniref:Uncharacterized protein n=1 Tax=Hermanssonia centrifuga TaxID=98765 RepID=A0A2R6NHF0_9APHY|nr:hypothetical protein PHLCEN_2v12316 [Hermanssonia centrifuga]